MKNRGEPVKQKVVHFIKLSDVGGIQASLVNLLDTPIIWRKRTHVAIHNGLDRPLKQWTQRLKSVNANGRWIPVPPILPGRLRKRLRAVLNYLTIRRYRPDVCVFWNTLPPPWQLRKLTANGILPLLYDRGVSTLSERNSRNLESYGLFNAVICNSKATARLLQLKWQIEVQTFVNRNAVRPDILPGGDRQSDPKAFPTNNQVTIGFAGRLVPLKGASLVLVAARELIERRWEVKVDIAGSGSEQPFLNKLSRELSVDDIVYWRNDCKDMREFYSSIDVLVCPSLREPFGNVSVEAQAWGCPVVATGVDGLPETLVDGETGVIVRPGMGLEQYMRYASSVNRLPAFVLDPFADQLSEPRAPEPSAIASAIEAICSETDVYERMSSAARAYSQSEFSFERHAERLDEILDRISAESTD